MRTIIVDFKFVCFLLRFSIFVSGNLEKNIKNYKIKNNNCIFKIFQNYSRFSFKYYNITFCSKSTTHRRNYFSSIMQSGWLV